MDSLQKKRRVTGRTATMNCCVPEFVLEDDSSSSIFPFLMRKIPESAGEDFAELLWQNGPVLRRGSPGPPHADTALPVWTQVSASGVSSCSAAATTVTAAELFLEEDEMASWLDFPPGGDDDGGGSYHVPEKTQAAPAAAAMDHGSLVPKADRGAASGRPPLPPERQGKPAVYPRTKEPAVAAAASLPPSVSSVATVVDSSATPELAGGRPPASGVSPGRGRAETGTRENGLTSSSRAICEGEAAAKALARADEQKRKVPEDGDDSDSHSEDFDFESSDRKGDIRRSMSKRRLRAAEVHNLSERRRRDRINEKMKALQQLIPRCNKLDKASMLDDAIEYLKSLQMQVQMMSMGCDMFPMMFPGIQQFMPPMGMAVPMGMNMGMGLGMGMGMEMASATLNRPIMPFLPVMSSSHIAPTGAARMGQRLLVQPFHAAAAAFSEQMKLQAASQMDLASNHLACPAAPNAVQIPNHADPRQQYIGFPQLQVHPQNQAITKQGISKSTG